MRSHKVPRSHKLYVGPDRKQPRCATACAGTGLGDGCVRVSEAWVTAANASAADTRNHSLPVPPRTRLSSRALWTAASKRPCPWNTKAVETVKQWDDDRPSHRRRGSLDRPILTMSGASLRVAM
jgi:hypothetical protein